MDDYKDRIRASLRRSMTGWLQDVSIANHHNTSIAKVRADLTAMVASGELKTRMRGLNKEYALTGTT
jgi:hypothetical protein